ncbi:VWA domain-containing protein [Allorhodopirellula solitaria]|uniref:von Willebrand factor type A domain protein n=1 Tax=Allorhodopirellula solitaria TaxID=2527987 RepID=A0A5C5XVN0_9BACT|nr:VWA domain-containing protein [Allorhodopirellula solitaria]TWT66569.1 von Willebrand factor type A domain protein [Allorhodopirellula solitaria]
MQLTFDAPEYLWLLVLLPLVAVYGYRRLQSLGRLRCLVAILLRAAVIGAVVLAIAGTRLAWTTDRVSVMYVLDQSDSIQSDQRDRLYEYARRNAAEHRSASREDLAGVILFGADASIEIPPFHDDLPSGSGRGQVEIRTDATNLEQALTLAAASMPTDTRRRIVVFTDGNETQGHVETVASPIIASGIGIDFVAVPPHAGADVIVERIDMPTEIRTGQPLEARVVVESIGQSDPDLSESDGPAGTVDSGQPGGEKQGIVKGRLRITRTFNGEEELLAEQTVEVTPGKNVFPLQHTITRPAPYTYAAQFIADTASSDTRDQNNRSSTFVNVRGKSRVLLIEPAKASEDWSQFVDMLRDEAIEVTVQPSDATFTSLAELQAYDAVILANVPRVSGDSASTISQFTDDQISLLVRNTQQLGAGLLMIGGPDSLGAGGWTGTEIETAMPVDFEIKNSKVNAVGALSLVIDSSGSMDGEKMLLCKAAARAAVMMLGPNDSLGVISFDSAAHEVIPMQKIGQRSHMLPMIGRIRPGGGTDMYPAMRQAYADLVRADAAVKHMIVLTDGQTSPGAFLELVQQMKDAGITVTSVAIGQGADVNLLRRIANSGGGKLYHVISPKAIPQIVMRESRRVSRPLIFESGPGVQPQITYSHELLAGIDTPPPIHGYVMTTMKDSPLAQSLIAAPGPQEMSHPILAVWQYGLGRSAVLTTDGGQRWAHDWNAWSGDSKLMSQLVRWLMRPAGDTGQFSLATIVRDGDVEVVVNALDAEDRFLNFLEPAASVLGPDLEPVGLSLSQSSPGRYSGTFSADQAGNYFIQVVPDASSAPLTTAVTVSASKEYRARQTNVPLMDRVAKSETDEASSGEVVRLAGADVGGIIELNPYRSGLAAIGSIRDAWPMLVLLACCLFFLDVMVRRIAPRFGWLKQFVSPSPSQSDGVAASVDRLDALRQAKSQAHAGKRSFTVDETPAERENEPPAEELSYSERLLRAKQNARRP